MYSVTELKYSTIWLNIRVPLYMLWVNVPENQNREDFQKYISFLLKHIHTVRCSGTIQYEINRHSILIRFDGFS